VALPYAWSYWKFRVFNPIVAEGAINYSLISLGRLASLFLDLNQGMVVGLPCLILAVPTGFLAKLIIRIKFGQGFFRSEDWLLLGVVLMSIPVLAQVNWNAGQAIFMRYASWIAMPIVVWVAVALNQASGSWRQLIVISALAVQVAMVLLSGTTLVDRQNYVSFKPWVPLLWATAPGLYNPIPEIFFERTAGREGPIQTPAFYSPRSSGTFLKILSKSDDLDEVSTELCGERGHLRPAPYKTLSGPYVSRVEQGYFYISGHLRCIYSPPFELFFTSTSNLRLEMIGWSIPELHGTWSDGGRASIRVPLDRIPTGGLRVRLSGTAFVNDRVPAQLIKVNVAGQHIDSWNTLFPQRRVARELIVNSEKIGKDGVLILDFLFPNATSPAQLGLSGDSRQLSMALHSIQVDPM
jgi:hypothetical protein